ncbi:MAG: thymidine kinase [Deltaproteobacteria bacterium]|nr:thymidine kinase [Deltaproteobacteria bacterium]
MNPARYLTGGIEVVCGPMFSGKTEELMRRLRLAKIAKHRIQIFKPLIDDRYSTEHIQSHIDRKYECLPIKQASDILEHLQDETHVVGVDEAQFFGPEIVAICEKLARRRLRVIVAGLDQDFLGLPFGPMPQLLAIADDVVKLKAVCMTCGAPASKSQRLSQEKGQIVVGAAEQYEARCRFCFEAAVVPAKAGISS